LVSIPATHSVSCIELDRHGSPDGNSGIGTLPIPDAIPPAEAWSYCGEETEWRLSPLRLLSVSTTGQVIRRRGYKEETEWILVSSSRLPNFNQSKVI